MSQAHETHQGRQDMQYNITSEFWWPNMVTDIIRYLKQCETCASKQPVRKNLLATWPEAERWERLRRLISGLLQAFAELK